MAALDLLCFRAAMCLLGLTFRNLVTMVIPTFLVNPRLTPVCGTDMKCVDLRRVAAPTGIR